MSDCSEMIISSGAACPLLSAQAPAELRSSFSCNTSPRWLGSVCPTIASGRPIMAVVVHRDGPHRSADDVVQYCRGPLANYKKPMRVEFVTDLPHTVNHKVRPNELRAALGNLVD